MDVNHRPSYVVAAVVATIVALVATCCFFIDYFSPVNRALRVLHREPFDESGGFQVLDTLAEDAVPELVEELRSKDPHRQVAAAAALSYMGQKGGMAAEALTEAMNSPDFRVRTYAAIALGNLGGSARVAIPSLQRAANDPHPWVRQAAATALGQLLDSEKAAQKDLSPVAGPGERASEKRNSVRNERHKVNP